MVKESFSSLANFQDNIRPDNYIKTNEGHVYFKDEYVYKIFSFDYYDSNTYFFKEKNIKRLHRLDNNIFTIPISLVYFDGQFVGFKMINAGVTLANKYLTDGLSLEEKKLIAYSLKDISEYLSKKGIVHFDIHLENILYLGKNVKLTDINGMMFYPLYMRKQIYKLFLIRMPELYYYWLQRYGALYLDYLEINFCTHILFNCSQEFLIKLFKGTSIPVRSSYMYKLLDVENTSFEDDVFTYFREAFDEKRKTLDQHTYLIDHLK